MGGGGAGLSHPLRLVGPKGFRFQAESSQDAVYVGWEVDRCADFRGKAARLEDLLVDNQ